jgi:hypothetical protein
MFHVMIKKCSDSNKVCFSPGVNCQALRGNRALRNQGSFPCCSVVVDAGSHHSHVSSQQGRRQEVEHFIVYIK